MLDILQDKLNFSPQQTNSMTMGSEGKADQKGTKDTPAKGNMQILFGPGIGLNKGITVNVVGVIVVLLYFFKGPNLLKILREACTNVI